MQKQPFKRELITAMTYSALVLGVVSAIAYASAFHVAKTQWVHKMGPLLCVLLLVGVGALGALAITRLVISGKTALGVSLIPVAGLVCNFAF